LAARVSPRTVTVLVPAAGVRPRAADVFFVFDLADEAAIELRMSSDPIWDTFLYLFTGSCGAPQEVAFNDDYPEPGTGVARIALARLPAGRYWVVATGYQEWEEGDFTLSAAFSPPAPAPCGDGICDPVGEDRSSCPQDCLGICGDGICEGAENSRNCGDDCSENMPDCGDGECEGPIEDEQSCPLDCTPPLPVDNDTCAEATALTPAAGTNTVTVRGDTRAANRDLRLHCDDRANPAPEVLYTFTLPHEQEVAVHVIGDNLWDTYLYLLGSCGEQAAVLACDDDAGRVGESSLRTQLGAGQYWLAVAGFNAGDAGPFTLTLEWSPQDPACDDPNDQAEDEHGALVVEEDTTASGLICLQDNAWDLYRVRVPAGEAFTVRVQPDGDRQDELWMTARRAPEDGGEVVGEGNAWPGGLSLRNPHDESREVYITLENRGEAESGERSEHIEYIMQFVFYGDGHGG